MQLRDWKGDPVSKTRQARAMGAHTWLKGAEDTGVSVIRGSRLFVDLNLLALNGLTHQGYRRADGVMFPGEYWYTCEAQE